MKIMIPKPQPKREHLILGIMVTVLILLRIPSLFEPHWNTDEGTYAAIAHFLHSGSILYKDVWDDHPPGIHILYFIVGYFTTLNLFVIKLINLLFSIMTVLVIYKLAKRFFNKALGLISVFFAIFVLGLPLLEPSTTHPENFFILFSLLGIYNLLKEQNRTTLISGIWFGISAMFDLRVIFILCGVFIAILVPVITKNQKKKVFTTIIFFIIGLVIPWVISTLFLISQNSLTDFTRHVLETFVNQFKMESVDSLGFILVQSNPTSRAIFSITTILFGVFLFVKKAISRNQLFILLWGIATVYAILFPQVPHMHYLIQAIPIFAIISGYVIHRIQTTPGLKATVKFLSIYLLSIFFVLGFYSLGKDIINSGTTIRYYVNFVQYLTTSKDTTSYSQFFGDTINDGYLLNTYINQNMPDQKDIYVWTDNPWIVVLANLDQVVPHTQAYRALADFDEVEKNINQKNPSYIIIDTKSSDSSLLKGYILGNDYALNREFKSYLIYQKQDEGVLL